MRRQRYRSSPEEIEASDIDELILQPASGWEGSRGVRPTYGRLYRSSGDYRLSPASRGDTEVLLGRSGSSGYRGGRPFFGEDDELDQVFGGDHEAEWKLGPLEYRGPQLGGVALGLAAVLLLWKMAK